MNAPSPRQQAMLERIVSVDYHNPTVAPHLTIATLLLDNGFSLVGYDGPADPAAFDPELGKRYAIEDALRRHEPAFVLLEMEEARKAQALEHPIVLEEPPPAPAFTAAVQELVEEHAVQHETFRRLFRKARRQAESLESPAGTVWDGYMAQASVGFPSLCEVMGAALVHAKQPAWRERVQAWVAEAVAEDLR